MARGKYAHVVAKLKRDWGNDEKFQRKVDDVKDLILAPPREDDPNLTPPEVEKLIKDVQQSMSLIVTHLMRAAQGQQPAAIYARILGELHEVEDVFDDIKKGTLNIVQHAYEEIFVAQADYEGGDSFGLQSGGTVSYTSEPHGKVTDRDAYREWCIKDGLERSLMLPSATTIALVKRRLLAGQPAPPGIEVAARPKVRYTRPKNETKDWEFDEEE